MHKSVKRNDVDIEAILTDVLILVQVYALLTHPEELLMRIHAFELLIREKMQNDGVQLFEIAKLEQFLKDLTREL